MAENQAQPSTDNGVQVVVADNELQPTPCSKESETNFNSRFSRFVRCFVKRCEEKIKNISEGTNAETSPCGKIAEHAVTAVFAAIGVSVGRVDPCIKFGRKGGQLLGKYIGKKHYEELVHRITNTFTTTETVQLRLILVEAAAKIFQSFEMQFMTMASENTWGEVSEAIKQLAHKAVDKIMQNVDPTDDCVDISDMLTKALVSDKCNNLTNIKKKISKHVFNKLSFYEKPCIRIAEKPKDKFYKCKGYNLEYGCRFIFELESIKDKHGYENFEPESLLSYEYILQKKDIMDEKILEEINAINEEDPKFKHDQLYQTIQTILKYVEKLVNDGNLWDERKDNMFNVHKPIKSFTGRNTYLKQEGIDSIHGDLQTEKIVAIVGPGGIGKTELIRKFVHNFENEYDRNIIWINCSRKVNIIASFKEVANKISVFQPPDSFWEVGKLQGTQPFFVHQVLSFFSDKKCLFVFDDVDKFNDIEEFLPAQTPGSGTNVFVLAISRDKIKQDWKTKTMEWFTEDEAKQFLQGKLASLKLKDADIEKVVKTVGKLPLDLELVAACVQIRKEDPISKVVDDIGSTNKDCHGVLSLLLELIKEEYFGKQTLEKLTKLTFCFIENIPFNGVDIPFRDDDKANSLTPDKLYISVSDDDKANSLTKLYIAVPDDVKANSLTPAKLYIPAPDDGKANSLTPAKLYIPNPGKDDKANSLTPAKLYIAVPDDDKANSLTKLYIAVPDNDKANSPTKYIPAPDDDKANSLTPAKLYIPVPDDDKANSLTLAKWYKPVPGAVKFEELLEKYSLIVPPSKDKSVFNLHKVVQESLKKNFSEEEQQKILTAALSSLKKSTAENHVMTVWTSASKYSNLVDKFKREQYSAGNTILHLFAKYGHIDAMVNLLEGLQDDKEYEKEFLNLPNEHHNTALHLAAKTGFIEIVKYLIDEKNVDITINNSGRTPFEVAIVKGHLDVIDYFVKKLDSSAINKENLGPLCCAAVGGHLKVLKYLINEKKLNFLVRGSAPSLPIHKACESNKQDVVEYLLSLPGADVNVCDHEHNTPLHIAAQNEHMQLVKYLIEKKYARVSLKNTSKKTPAHYAVMCGNLDMVVYLWNKEEKKGLLCPRKGYSIWHEAAYNGKLEILKYFHQKCSTVQYGNRQWRSNPVDTHGNTLLHEASAGGFLNIVKYLVDTHNADINIANTKKQLPIHKAAACDKPRIVKYFLEDCLMEVDVQGDGGGTPLHEAAYHGALSVVKYLVKQGANVEEINMFKETPLFCVIKNTKPRNETPQPKYTRLDVMKYLVEEKGCKIDVEDNKGRTPLQYAEEKKNIDAVEYLKTRTHAH